jgi:hypothetical protein
MCKLKVSEHVNVDAHQYLSELEHEHERRHEHEQVHIHWPQCGQSAGWDQKEEGEPRNPCPTLLNK